MNTVLGNVSLRNNGTEPSEGRKAVQVQIDLTSGVGELDLVQVQQLGQIKSAQTIYVDNADNAFPITMQMVGTRQRMIVPANSQGYFNPVLPNPPVISFTSNPCLLNIQVMNFLIDPQVWSVSTGSGNVGTVTSVGLSAPAEFSVSGSPVTTAGVLGFDWNTEASNLILAGPATGPNAKPNFRALVAADIPALPYGAGTVTSVGLAAPGIFTVSGSPINAAGTLTLALANQGANTIWAGPTAGGAAAPTFRNLVAADIPSLSGIYLPLAGGALTGALTTSSTITPDQTKGIVGTTTNNNAQAGSVGEYISASASGIACATLTAVNVTSITLTAGDWDLHGYVEIGPTAVLTLIAGWISTVSAALPARPNGGAIFLIQENFGSGQSQGNPVGNMRLSVSVNTTVYLGARGDFSSGTCTALGFIGARRVR